MPLCKLSCTAVGICSGLKAGTRQALLAGSSSSDGRLGRQDKASAAQGCLRDALGRLVRQRQLGQQGLLQDGPQASLHGEGTTYNHDRVQC